MIMKKSKTTQRAKTTRFRTNWIKESIYFTFQAKLRTKRASRSSRFEPIWLRKKRVFCVCPITSQHNLVRSWEMSFSRTSQRGSICSAWTVLRAIGSWTYFNRLLRPTTTSKLSNMLTKSSTNSNIKIVFILLSLYE